MVNILITEISLILWENYTNGTKQRVKKIIIIIIY